MRRAILELSRRSEEEPTTDKRIDDALHLENITGRFHKRDDIVRDALRSIAQARRTLGPAPVAAIEHELARKRTDKPEVELSTDIFDVDARQVADFLETCDRVERATGATIPSDLTGRLFKRPSKGEGAEHDPEAPPPPPQDPE